MLTGNAPTIQSIPRNGFYYEVHSLLSEILNSEEVKDFEKPLERERLLSENKELRFALYWNNQHLKYVMHLTSLAFFIFAAACAVFYKEGSDKSGNCYRLIAGAVAFLTIAFNLFFNNHQAFRDAWSLLLPNACSRLKERKRKEFISNTK